MPTERRVWRTHSKVATGLDIAEARANGCSEIQHIDELSVPGLYVEMVADPEMPLDERLKAIEAEIAILKARG